MTHPSFIISAFISLYHLSHNQYAIRYAIGFAIGDFNLVYTGVCIVSIIVYLMLNKRLNMQLMIILIISVLLVLKANYMTAIALMSVLILLSILLKIRKNYVLFMIIFIALISLLLLKLESVARFILVISELKIFSNAIKIRLIDISNFLSNRNLLNSNTLQTRLELSSISWNTFKDNFWFGVDYTKYNSITIGNHTQWIDNLARFGIIGAFIFCLQLIKWLIRIYKNTNNYLSKNTIILSWSLFVLLGIINNNMLGGLFICMFFVANNISLLVKKV